MANSQEREELQDGGRPDGRGVDEGEGTADRSDRTFEPSKVQVNRGREQGLGVGQKEIDYQRDPTGADSAEQYGEAGEDAGPANVKGGTKA